MALSGKVLVLKLDTMVSELSFLSEFPASSARDSPSYTAAVIPKNSDAHTFAKEFYNFLGKLLPSGKAQLEPKSVRLMPGGLEKVTQDGFRLLGTGLVSERLEIERPEEYMRPISAEKLVYRL